MQCPSCRFENMPGLDSCGRCGTTLGLSTATIDINPPRASKSAKRVRKMVPTRLIYQARDVAAEARRVVSGSIVDDSRVPLPTPEVLSRLVVPGWAHIHLGMPARGQVFLLAYLPLLFAGLLYWGTGMGGVLLGLAFSVHTSSVTDILIRQGTVRFPRIMAIAAFVSLALAVLLYVPAGLTLTQVAAPIEFAIDTPPFKRLDVVLVNHWAFALTAPRRGDVVLYSPRNSMRTRGGRHSESGPCAVRVRGKPAYRPRHRASGRPRRVGPGQAYDQRRGRLLETATPSSVCPATWKSLYLRIATSFCHRRRRVRFGSAVPSRSGRRQG